MTSKIRKRIMIFLHGFMGIGAISGGLAAVTNPAEPLGISVDMLKNAPFDDFFIPGLLLIFYLGLGNLVALALLIKNTKIQFWFSGFMGLSMVMWIGIQCYMLWTVAALHIIFFILGAVQGLLSLFALFKEDEWLKTVFTKG